MLILMYYQFGWISLSDKKLTLITFTAISLSSCASWYDVKVDQPAAYHVPAQIDNNYNIDGALLFVLRPKIIMVILTGNANQAMIF